MLPRKAGCENVVSGCCRVDPGASRPHPSVVLPKPPLLAAPAVDSDGGSPVAEIADAGRRFTIKAFPANSCARQKASAIAAALEPHWSQPAAAMPVYTDDVRRQPGGRRYGESESGCGRIPKRRMAGTHDDAVDEPPDQGQTRSKTPPPARPNSRSKLAIVNTGSRGESKSPPTQPRSSGTGRPARCEMARCEMAWPRMDRPREMSHQARKCSVARQSAARSRRHGGQRRRDGPAAIRSVGNRGR